MTAVAAADGFPLEVQTSGRQDGPALLLLPGQANSHLWWSTLRAGFDPHCRVITFDYRGTGGSRGGLGDWSAWSFADDAAHVLSELGAPPAAVYGTSMGGRVAQQLAIRHPDAVHRLVLACTSPGGPHAVERDPEIRRALGHPDRAARQAVLQRLFYTDTWPHAPADSVLFGDETMTPKERRVHLRVSDNHDAWDALPSVAAPTLVLHGSEDAMVPTANAALLAGRIPGAQLHLHDGGRHGFFEQFAAEITPRVLDFLL